MKMSKLTAAILLAVLVIATFSFRSEADTWFFVLPDYPNGGTEIVDVPGIMTLDVMVFNQWDHNDAGDLSEVRFVAPIPECFTGAVYMGDVHLFETIGDSQTGAAVLFSPCLLSGNTLYSVLRIVVMAQGLTSSECYYRVSPHPRDESEYIASLSCEGTFALCGFTIDTPIVAGGAIPNEATTWGRIKSIYSGER
jgi:hypothetical protein